MKIADSANIKSGERELISSIMEKLDPETLAQVATKQLSPDKMEFMNGDLVIRGNQIVYKMDFRATLEISVMFDRNGELVPEGEDGLDGGMGETGEGVWDKEAIMDEEIDDPEASMEEENKEFLDEYTESDPGGLDDTIADAEPQSLDDELAQVFRRTRDFWQQKREAAKEDTDISEASGDA